MKRLVLAGMVVLGLVAGSVQRTDAQTAVDPGTFAVSIWEFPAPAKVLASEVETNAMAAGNQLVLHLGSKSFADEGRLTGYFMNAGVGNLDPSGNTHPVLTYYLVSTFGSADQATAAFAQQRDGWEQMATDPTSSVQAQVVDLGGQQFGDQVARGLYVVPVPSNNGQMDIAELLFRRGAYLIEIWQAYLVKDADPYGKAAQPYLFSIGKQLDAIASGTAPTPTPAATPPVDFSILSTRFESNKMSADLKQTPLTKVKTGTTVQMAIYFAVKSAPPNAKFSGDFKLSRGKRTRHVKFSHTFGAYPPDYYHEYVYNVPLDHSGTYTFTGTLTINGVTKRGTATITASGHALSATFEMGRQPAMQSYNALAGSIRRVAGPHLMSSHPAGHTAGAQLLQRAISDTNVAQTYREVDSAKEVTSKQTLIMTAWEQYDELHNRERDHATVLSVGHRSGGKSERYTVDVVMMDGRTFHRSSRDGKGWQVQSGYGYTDPASGQQWSRSSLRFSFLAQLPLVSHTAASSGQQHYRFRIPLQSPARGHAFADVWMTAGDRPYIVRYDETADYTLRGKQVQLRLRSDLSDFNQPVNISAPKIGS